MADDAYRQDVFYLGTLIAAIAVLFAAKDLFSFLTVAEFAGRDLVANYAYAELMQHNLLDGSIMQWSNQHLLGFPAFRFYPPLFFALVAGTSILAGISLTMVFKAVVFLSIAATPFLTYLLLRTCCGKLESFLGGFYTLYALFVYPPVSLTYQTFSVGLVAQAAAIPFLLLTMWLAFEGNMWLNAVAGFLAGVTTLVHPYVGLVAFTFLAAAMIIDFRTWRVWGAVAGLVIPLPWLVPALDGMQYLGSYAMGAANIGWFSLLLLPLILLGGFSGKLHRTTFLTFVATALVSTGVFPIITQELRFFTYTLLLGSILAGIGAYRIYEHVKPFLSTSAIIVLLCLPVIGLSLHADLPQSWQFQGELDGFMQEMDDLPQGRVMVETNNRSIFDDYILQARIPQETRHWTVNELHLDSSTSANYILALEHWISASAIRNTLCGICDSPRPDNGVISRRMDDLGIDYITAYTDTAAQHLSRFMDRSFQEGGLTVFSTRNETELVEPLNRQPVALVGSFDQWQEVNNRVFSTNVSQPVVWVPAGDSVRFERSIRLAEHRPGEVVERLRAMETEPVSSTGVSYSVNDSAVSISTDTERRVPVAVKMSWYPSITSDSQLYTGRFNTLLVLVQSDATVFLG